jgi:hypothetical protein
MAPGRFLIGNSPKGEGLDASEGPRDSSLDLISLIVASTRPKDPEDIFCDVEKQMVRRTKLKLSVTCAHF